MLYRLLDRTCTGTDNLYPWSSIKIPLKQIWLFSLSTLGGPNHILNPAGFEMAVLVRQPKYFLYFEIQMQDYVCFRIRSYIRIFLPTKDIESDKHSVLYSYAEPLGSLVKDVFRGSIYIERSTPSLFLWNKKTEGFQFLHIFVRQFLSKREAVNSKIGGN